jgi:two-component system, chemotaxis family, protein-glutamate methylesterase/glutaminase
VIRVLVVDDSVTIRTLVSALLKEDPEIEVAGVAPDGRVGLAKFGQLRPDVVTLDVEMPTMDGLATLEAIRREDPSAVVIMCSSLTHRGASTTFDALAAGASDYVAKPDGMHAEQALKEFGTELIAKVKAHARRKQPVTARAAAPVKLAPPKTKQKVEVVAVASSTGGPNALATFIPALPKGFPLPVVLVQHMPPLFTQLLAERLDATSPVRVVEGTDGMPLEPGTVYIAPGGHHMETMRDGATYRLRLHDGPQENCCRPAADVLFRSTVKCFGAGVLGVVLTGMGQDGMLGSQAIHAAGGQVLAQDEATSVVWGMPRAVAEAGLAQAVLPLEELGKEVVRRVHKNG